MLLRRLRPVALLSLFVLLSCQGASDLFDFDDDGSLDGDDCNPTDPLINPNANDPYGDGIDQNCDGVDGNAVDQDLDGYSNARDCDDNDPDINPGADDSFGDGIDQNCDGVDGMAVDQDNDGYSDAWDCDDQDPSIYPGADDPFGDGIDQNCDGVDGVAVPGDDDDSAGDDDDSLSDPEDCSDGLDNDLDGDSDCEDSDCAFTGFCMENCSDGLDNDFDGDFDCDDSDCEFTGFCLENCSDGVDNNEDGDIDCDDLSCADAVVCAGDDDDSAGDDDDSAFVWVTETLQYTGTDQEFVVPAGVTSITAKLWGAGAGGATDEHGNPTPPQAPAGGYATGEISVTPGETLTLIVGQGGGYTAGSNTFTPPTFGGGGRGFVGNHAGAGGGGGGYAGLFRGSVSQANALLIAAGAGGIYGYKHPPAQQGTGIVPGYAGGLSAVDPHGGESEPFANPGGGGTQTAGGAGGTWSGLEQGTAGSALQGGDGGHVGGGGGGGYFGGGGGAHTAYGGGGSAFLGTATSASTIPSTGVDPPNTSDADYIAGVGVGGNKGVTIGSNPAGYGGDALIALSYWVDDDTGGDDDDSAALVWVAETLQYTGADQQFVVPAAVTSVDVTLWGAGGGAGPVTGGPSPPDSGAGGGFARATVAVTPGEVLTVVVGRGGTQIHNGPADYGFGGYGNNVYLATHSAGINGTGGGLAGIFRGVVSQGNALVIAGGGGGGGHHDTLLPSWIMDGGPGGGAEGVDAQSSPGDEATGGRGGTQSAGGVGGTGPRSSGGDGGALLGGQSRATGNDWYAGGCGGAGYFGGGGGGMGPMFGPTVGAGGGGGSSYAVPAAQNVVLLAGTGADPANQQDPLYVAGVGVGAPVTAAGTEGGDGLVVIEYLSAGVAAGDGSTPAEASLSCAQLISSHPTTPTGTYWIDGDGDGDTSNATEEFCDMVIEGGGWTRCYFAADGSFGYATWGMPGNTCFGASASGDMLWRGADSESIYIVAHATDPSSYANWCSSTDSIQGVGMARQVSTTVNYWGLWTYYSCYLGGNNNNGSYVFYSWSHNCGGNNTLSIGETQGNGCDYEQYALGDLWIFYR